MRLNNKGRLGKLSNILALGGSGIPDGQINTELLSGLEELTSQDSNTTTDLGNKKFEPYDMSIYEWPDENGGIIWNRYTPYSADEENYKNIVSKFPKEMSTIENDDRKFTVLDRYDYLLKLKNSGLNAAEVRPGWYLIKDMYGNPTNTFTTINGQEDIDLLNHAVTNLGYGHLLGPGHEGELYYDDIDNQYKINALIKAGLYDGSFDQYTWGPEEDALWEKYLKGEGLKYNDILEMLSHVSYNPREALKSKYPLYFIPFDPEKKIVFGGDVNPNWRGAVMSSNMLDRIWEDVGGNPDRFKTAMAFIMNETTGGKYRMTPKDQTFSDYSASIDPTLPLDRRVFAYTGGDRYADPEDSNSWEGIPETELVSNWRQYVGNAGLNSLTKAAYDAHQKALRIMFDTNYNKTYNTDGITDEDIKALRAKSDLTKKQLKYMEEHPITESPILNLVKTYELYVKDGKSLNPGSANYMPLIKRTIDLVGNEPIIRDFLNSKMKHSYGGNLFDYSPEPNLFASGGLEDNNIFGTWLSPIQLKDVTVTPEAQAPLEINTNLLLFTPYSQTLTLYSPKASPLESSLPELSTSGTPEISSSRPEDSRLDFLVGLYGRDKDRKGYTVDYCNPKRFPHTGWGVEDGIIKNLDLMFFYPFLEDTFNRMLRLATAEEKKITGLDRKDAEDAFFRWFHGYPYQDEESFKAPKRRINRNGQGQQGLIVMADAYDNDNIAGGWLHLYNPKEGIDSSLVTMYDFTDPKKDDGSLMTVNTGNHEFGHAIGHLFSLDGLTDFSGDGERFDIIKQAFPHTTAEDGSYKPLYITDVHDNSVGEEWLRREGAPIMRELRGSIQYTHPDYHYMVPDFVRDPATGEIDYSMPPKFPEAYYPTGNVYDGLVDKMDDNEFMSYFFDLGYTPRTPEIEEYYRTYTTHPEDLPNIVTNLLFGNLKLLDLFFNVLDKRRAALNNRELLKLELNIPGLQKEYDTIINSGGKGKKAKKALDRAEVLYLEMLQDPKYKAPGVGSAQLTFSANLETNNKLMALYNLYKDVVDSNSLNTKDIFSLDGLNDNAKNFMTNYGSHIIGDMYKNNTEEPRSISIDPSLPLDNATKLAMLLYMYLLGAKNKLYEIKPLKGPWDHEKVQKIKDASKVASMLPNEYIPLEEEYPYYDGSKILGDTNMAAYGGNLYSDGGYYNEGLYPELLDAAMYPYVPQNSYSEYGLPQIIGLPLEYPQYSEDVPLLYYTPEQLYALLLLYTQNLVDDLYLLRLISAKNLQDYPENTVFADGGTININPNNRGKFKDKADAVGMTVQLFADHVLSNRDSYPSSTVKLANFAKNAAKWHNS